nr:unnamed protein product [Digitaria exilis]
MERPATAAEKNDVSVYGGVWKAPTEHGLRVELRARMVERPARRAPPVAGGRAEPRGMILQAGDSLQPPTIL